MRVRSIRGTGFFTHSSKKVYGSQSQKFMFVDGDKAVSGSYSFTWTASRLDRSIITVLTGQAVDLFDHLFQDLYMMSNAIDLNKINLEKEQKLEPISKAAPALQTTNTLALKLINPKYALVSGNAAVSSNHMISETCTAKSNSIKQMKEVSEGPYIHPGLLHLEKANMFEYLPVWPEPDPPSDVIGFINIRDYNKPLQAHLTHSEIFEVSQAIRFKDPIHRPQESLSEKICPSTTSQNSASPNEQPQKKLEGKNKQCNYPQQILLPSSLKKQVVGLSSIPTLTPAESSKQDEKNVSVVDVIEKHVFSQQREKLDGENICTSADPCKDSQISQNPAIENITPFGSVRCNTVATTSDKIICENIAETSSNKDFQDNRWNTHKLIEPDEHKTDHVDCTVHKGKSIYSDSRSSFSSEEYFDCRESASVNSENVGMFNRIQAVFRFPDEPNNAAETSSSLMSGSCKNTSIHEALNETEDSKLKCASPEERNVQHVTGVTVGLELTSMNGGKSLSESVSIANKHLIQETDFTPQQGTDSKLLHQFQTDTHVAPDKNTECLQRCESYSAVNHIFDTQPIEKNNSAESQLLVNKSLLKDNVAAPYVPVQKIAEAQCIVFSDTLYKVPVLSLNPEIDSGESTIEKAIEVKDMDNSISEPKDSPTARTMDKEQQLSLKILTGFKVVHFSVDIHPLKRKTLEHLCVQQESKKQPEVKPTMERNIRMPHRVSPQPKPFPKHDVKLSSTKASVTKLHSRNHLTPPAVSTPGVQNNLPGRLWGENRVTNDLL
ncbi:protein FAM83G [Tachysurus ichikawai]